MSKIKVFTPNDVPKIVKEFESKELNLIKQKYTSVFLENTRFMNFNYKFSIFKGKTEIVQYVKEIINKDLGIGISNINSDKVWFKKNKMIGFICFVGSEAHIKTVDEMWLVEKKIIISERKDKYIFALEEQNVIDVEKLKISKNMLGRNNSINSKYFELRLKYSYCDLNEKQRNNFLKKINKITDKIK